MYITHLHIKQRPRRYEQVEQGSCADPGFFVRRGGGGGGGGGSRPAGQKTVWAMFFLVINLFYSLQCGSNGFYYRVEEGVQLLPGGGGVQRNLYNL